MGKFSALRPTWLIVLFSVSLGVTTVAGSYGLRGYGSQFGQAPILERFSWKVLDWAYPDEASRQAAIASGDYIPENGLPVGIEVWRNKLFVTVPRWKDGEDYITYPYSDEI